MISDMRNLLRGHFDCVQILVSRSTPQGTERYFIGAGNWYGRTGMAHSFIQCDEAEVTSYKIAEKLNPKDDT